MKVICVCVGVVELFAVTQDLHLNKPIYIRCLIQSSLNPKKEIPLQIIQTIKEDGGGGIKRGRI